jgi:hypothetical protein
MVTFSQPLMIDEEHNAQVKRPFHETPTANSIHV